MARSCRLRPRHGVGDRLQLVNQRQGGSRVEQRVDGRFVISLDTSIDIDIAVATETGTGTRVSVRIA